MPIYEYDCKECKKTSEYLLLPSEYNSLQPCYFCGSIDTYRIVSNVYFTFGTGAPTQDLKNEKYNKQEYMKNFRRKDNV